MNTHRWMLKRCFCILISTLPPVDSWWYRKAPTIIWIAVIDVCPWEPKSYGYWNYKECHSQTKLPILHCMGGSNLAPSSDFSRNFSGLKGWSIFQVLAWDCYLIALVLLICLHLSAWGLFVCCGIYLYFFPSFFFFVSLSFVFCFALPLLFFQLFFFYNYGVILKSL